MNENLQASAKRSLNAVSNARDAVAEVARLLDAEQPDYATITAVLLYGSEVFGVAFRELNQVATEWQVMTKKLEKEARAQKTAQAPTAVLKA